MSAGCAAHHAFRFLSYGPLDEKRFLALLQTDHVQQDIDHQGNPADGREQLQREQLQQEMLRDHQAATRRAQRVMQQRENQYRYQPQEN